MQKLITIIAALTIASVAVGQTNFPDKIGEGTTIGSGSWIDNGVVGGGAISDGEGHAESSADGAWQIGTGDNAEGNSLQFKSTPVVDDDLGALCIQPYGNMVANHILYSEDWLNGAGFVAGAGDDEGKFSENADGTEWLVTVVDGGADNGESIVIADDAVGGALAIQANNAANDNVNCQKNGEMLGLTAGSETWFKAKFKVEDADVNALQIGLAQAGATDTTGTPPTDGIWFEKDAGAATLDFMVATNSVVVTNAAITTLSNDTYVNVAWYYDGVGTVTLAVDGSAVTVTGIAAVNLPLGEALSPVMHWDMEDVNQDLLSVDYIGCFTER